MHRVHFNDENLRTDLILDQKEKVHKKYEVENNHIKVVRCEDESWNYSTLFFDDITDRDSYLSLQKMLVEELKEYISISSNDVILVLGLGNKESTPDSLGPNSLSHILVTRYFFLLGDVDSCYSNVSIFAPNVLGNTGIDSVSVIKKLIDELKPTKIIAIDALKANQLERLTKTIQITNSGIHPGSGIENNRGEISKKTVGCDVIAIGVPTVMDLHDIRKEENSFMITPTNIDFVIEKLASLIGNSLNIVFHKDYLRQI